MQRRGAEGGARRLAGVAVAIITALFMLGPAAAGVLAQTPSLQPKPAPDLELEANEVVEQPPAETSSAVPEPTDVLKAGSPTATTAAPAAKQAANITSGKGSAQEQPLDAKRKEAAKKCVEKTQISSLLGFPGSVGSDAGGSWGLLLLAVGLGSGALALFIWVRRFMHGKSESRDPLETVSTIVALVSTIVGLAVTFVPGVGIDGPPPPDAQMTVREAHKRITHGEYATQTATSAGDDNVDKREVGNVIWLKLHLSGYADKQLLLQYGSYRFGGGGQLLPGTARFIDLGRQREDVQTTHLPVWVGYPRRVEGLENFQAQFRLVDERDQILDMAHTSHMKAWPYRYACLDNRGHS